METYLKRYPGQVTTASIVHNESRGDITLYVITEDIENDRPTRRRKEKLTKWDMKDIRSSSEGRQLKLTEEEHIAFTEALQTEDGRKAIAELKNTIINQEVDQAIDFIHDKVLKAPSLKRVINTLKNEKLTEYGTKSESSLSIDVKQMYDFLVEKGIIKIEQSINV